MEEYRVLGLMSGTSMDGLDLALCKFIHAKGSWQYRILCAETISYPTSLETRLRNAYSLPAPDFALLDVEFGDYMGKQCKSFLEKHGMGADLISSHGHTIFHQPEKKLSVQIGSGAAILAASRIETVCDFRSLNVALGGQGAPLVPIGDKLLFAEYDFCLNLGGIANISFDKEGLRRAFDICPCNILLNHFASELGFAYDEGGRLGASGKLHEDLLESLNEAEYYKKSFPKSLGIEDIRAAFFPIFKRYDLSPADNLRSMYEHIAVQTGKAIRQAGKQEKTKVLISGGGAFNDFLIGRIRDYSFTEVIIPDTITIQFKEALIFAFLGVLRKRNETNCLQSVTGSSEDHTSGCIYSM
jgi:anhydro-N-acetylmuramic acid kinase